MSRVFLSYAREDVDAAKQLAEHLSHAGHQVWWDRHLHGGSRFAVEIDRELKQAEAVLVLWSEISVASAWVQDEAAETLLARFQNDIPGIADRWVSFLILVRRVI